MRVCGRGAVRDPFRPMRSTRPAIAPATQAYRTLPVVPSLATTPFVPTGSVIFRERVRTAAGRANWTGQRAAQVFDGDRATRPAGASGNAISQITARLVDLVAQRPGTLPNATR